MRLFVALELSQEVREAIAALIRALKPLDESWKWTRAENLHITLKFLGEVPEEKLDRVVVALRAVVLSESLALQFRELGFFPDERRPRVLWIGVHAPPALPCLTTSIEETLETIGIPREERAYTPHLTLARGKEGRVSPTLRNELLRHARRDFGTITATAFHLIRSELKSSGAEYTTLASFPGNQKPA